MDANFLDIIAALSPLSAIVFAYLAFARNKKKDAADDAGNQAGLLVELGYIKSGVDDIKRKQEQQDERYIEVITRLTAVEASAKQAHKRLDAIAGQEGRE